MFDKNRYVKEWEDESLLYYEWEKIKELKSKNGKKEEERA